MAAMIADTSARHLFLDSAAAASLEGQSVAASDRITMDGSGVGVALADWRSEEHTSELQSLMRISYAVFCLKKKTKQIKIIHDNIHKSSKKKQKYNAKYK